MFSNLKPQAPDGILALMQMFRDDPRSEKIDLGVGVYKNAAGVTPIMQAVKSAEHQLWETESTKSYTGLIGDPAFGSALRHMILHGAVDNDRVAFAATPGGTGAVRQALELIKLANPDATIWVSTPTWPNHLSIIRFMGMKMAPYRYFDAATRGVDFDGMTTDLKSAKPGDVVLLHGCCHNPTGANLTTDQWETVASILDAGGLLPFIDLAYQGFGDGLEADAAATRFVASRMPETIIAASCSKNFGIYRERTGLLVAISPTAAEQSTTQGTLAFLNRQNFSFPPDHGARMVTMILNDDALKTQWQTDLEQMRVGMLSIREQLAAELRKRTDTDKFDFLAHHRGMFSQIGATIEQVETLRSVHGIYMVSDSRMNIAGLNVKNVPTLASAIAEVGV